MKKLSVILLLCGLTTGCGTLIRLSRDNDPNQNTIFMATTTDLAFVSLWLPLKRPPEPSTSFGPSMGLLMCFTPVAIIDLPFAIVMDSILFPFDLYKYRKIAKATRASGKVYEYWDNTFQSGIIDKDEVRINFTEYGCQIVQQRISADAECRASNVVAVLFDLVTANNDMPDLVYALCSYKGLSPDQYRKLYSLSLPHPYSEDIIGINLIQNPIIPVDLLSKIAEGPNVYHCMKHLKRGVCPRREP